MAAPVEKKPDKGGGGGGGKKPVAPPPPAENVLIEIIIAILILLLVVPFAMSIFTGASTGAFSVVGDFFAKVLAFLKTASAIFTMVAFAITAYSFFMIQELVHEENKRLGLTLTWETEKKQKNKRWQRVEEHMTSLNPSDWKIAILEADNILDEVTKRMGFSGGTLGERLRTIPAADFPYLEEAWQAHKFRNALAHKGTEFPLVRSDAEQIINIYYRIFSGLGYL